MNIGMMTLPLVLFCRCGSLRLRGKYGQGAGSPRTSATSACRDEGGIEEKTG
jgi:hypothetical protein